MLKLLDSESLAVVGSPMRRQLLEALTEPASASGLARRLGMSRQRIGYHMRKLERSGLIELVERRARRGCTERLYRAQPLAYVLESGRSDEAALRQDRYSWAALISLVGSVLRELVTLRGRADGAGKRLATLAIETRVSFAGPSERKAFTEEVSAAIQAIAGKYQSAAGSARRYRLFLGAYPCLDDRREEKS